VRLQDVVGDVELFDLDFGGFQLGNLVVELAEHKRGLFGFNFSFGKHLVDEVGLLNEHVIHSAPVVNWFDDLWEGGFDLVDDDLMSHSDVLLHFKLDTLQLSHNFVLFFIAGLVLVLGKLQ